MIRVKVNVVITLIMLTFMLLHILGCAFGIKNRNQYTRIQ